MLIPDTDGCRKAVVGVANTDTNIPKKHRIWRI